ncbi:hypothetical protein ASF22_07930 [Methylobacterium sp. Leaf87]|nr:hypothetical protein ASF22_07930 [Methylobacterium sp. Leaf87]
MFVDASAFVAMILREPEAQALTDRLEAAPAPITRPWPSTRPSWPLRASAVAASRRRGRMSG